MITRTDSQALTRARGMFGKTGWCERLKEKHVLNQARRELLGWLDFLTLIVRSLDLLGSEVVADAIHSVRRRTLTAVGPYRVGDTMFGMNGLPPLRTIQGHGWDWDEAFAAAEERTGKQS